MTAYLHFNFKFDAKIEIYDVEEKIFQAFSNSNLSSELDLFVDKLEPFEIKVFALKKNEISYSAQISIVDNKLISNSKQVQIFALPENHFYFVFFPLVIKNQSFDKFDKVEIGEGKIKTLTLLNDINKHAKVEIFEQSGDKLTKLDNYFVSLSKEKTKYINPAIIFLEFFEDLKVMDIKSASMYFTSSLSSKLNENTLLSFFEKFDDCYLINYYDDFAVLTLNFLDNKAKVYGANFENNLISNIYEIE